MGIDEYTSQELLDELQKRVRQRYVGRRYRAGVPTSMLGMVEELGELAEALLREQADFRPTLRESLSKRDPPEHEVGDILVYALAICNTLNVQAEWQGG